MHLSKPILNIELYEGTVINRPSKKIKSPYLADVLLAHTKSEELCHTPSHGCCGMVSKGNKVLMTKINS